MPPPGKDESNYRDGVEEAYPILWVGNLSVDTLDFDLLSLFSKHGVLDCVMTFSARNFAFLYFKHAADAKTAKDDLQGALVRGNSIRIEFARPVRFPLSCIDALAVIVSNSTTARLFPQRRSR